MSGTLFSRAVIFDGHSDSARGPVDVRIVGSRIDAVSAAPLAPLPGEKIIEAAAGNVLMPGLIDAHVHVYAWSVNLARVVRQPATYQGVAGARFLEAALARGFTTVRDVGGGDVGLAAAARDGLIDGSRLVYGGRVISQTGGHGDLRPGDHELREPIMCGCAGYADSFAVIADGVDAVRRAVREELRRGAAHVKIMGSGGVSSPTDPLECCQYAAEEIAAAVNEASRAGKYIAAHCHPDIAIHRCAELGVRSIEHATMISPETARFVAEKGAWCVPTMAIIFALLSDGERLGFPTGSMDKLRRVSDFALAGLEHMHAAGVNMGFGTDLLGELQTRQTSEFTLRRQVLPAAAILRSATSGNARLLGMEGEIGVIAPGALADLLLIDGDPMVDIDVLTKPRNLRIFKGGREVVQMIK